MSAPPLVSMNGHAAAHDAPPLVVTRFSFNTELRVLSALIFRPSVVTPHLARLNADLFKDELNRRLAVAALDAIRAGELADWARIGETIVNEGAFTADEVAQLVRDLDDFTIMDLPRHVMLDIDELTERRNALLMCEVSESVGLSLQRGELTPGQAAERLMGLQAEIDAENVVKLPTLADALESDPADESSEIFSTGIDGFDAMLPDGGLHPGDKVALAAKPGAGKSALALQVGCMAQIRNPDLRVCWALGEMSVKQLRNRALMCLSGLTIGVLRLPWPKLSEYQAEKKRAAIEAMRGFAGRFYIVEPPLTPGRIESVVAHSGARLLVVDYLQLVRGDGESQSRRDEIDGIIRSLTTLANRRGVASFWLSAMPKSATERKDIYSVFKESSEVAHACDLAYLLDPMGDADADCANVPDVVGLRLSCLKARHGTPLSALLRFDRPTQRIDWGPRR